MKFEVAILSYDPIQELSETDACRQRFRISCLYSILIWEYTPDSIEAGGIAGTIDSCVEGCLVQADIAVAHTAAQSLAVGGVVPKLMEGCWVKNCYVGGKISATVQGNSSATAGGVVGNANAGAKIENCISIAEVFASSKYSRSGVLVGIHPWDVFTMKNCVVPQNNYNRMYANQHQPNVDYPDTLVIENCYGVDTATAEQFNSQSFYTETLGWNAEDWSFEKQSN